MINNGRDSITGVIVFADRQFAQVIEGPEAAVNALYTRILADWRHSDVQLDVREACTRRRFPSWSMAYVGFEADLQPIFNALTGRSDLAPDMAGIMCDLADMLEPPPRVVRHG